MKLICWMICITVPVVNEAQPPVAAVPFTTAGAFFALSVADRQESARWYSEKFGLRVVMDASAPKSTATVLEGGGLIVELVQNEDAQPLATAAPKVQSSIYIHGIFKAGLIVDDFDATVAQLRARNVEIAFGPYPARSGPRANVIVRDNAGNLIQFFGK
jgi:catechol 2,3-dioxygenase-like lactoylglutathione lyase family enzyme